MDITSEEDEDEPMEQATSAIVHSPPKTPQEHDTKRHKRNLAFSPTFHPPNDANFQEFEETFDIWYTDRSPTNGRESPEQEQQKRRIYDSLITRKISINAFPQCIQPGQTFDSLIHTIQEQDEPTDNPGDNRVGENE